MIRKIHYKAAFVAALFAVTGLFTNGMAQAKKSKKPAPKADRIQIIRKDADKRVEVMIDGKLFTAYIYPGPAVLKKPVLWPIHTAKGTAITRGWPLNPQQNERVDHPHHVGLWFNHGDVNGHDFWNNSNAVGKEHKGPFGTIVHKEIKSTKGGKDQGELVVTMDWLDKDGQVMLVEETKFVFSGTGSLRTIDRISKLTAQGKEVTIKDNKEGMLALRVARALEQPSNKPEVYTDASGKTTAVPVLNNAGVTGQYHSAEGLDGDRVWGTRAKWMNLFGQIKDEAISVAIIDHPENFGYPTHWHARGYGLFSANPIGAKTFSNGVEPAAILTIKPNESVTFRHRLAISSGTVLLDDKLDEQANKFALVK